MTRGRGIVVAAVALAAVAATLLAVGLARQEPSPPAVPRSAPSAPPAPTNPAEPAQPSASDGSVTGPVLPASDPVALSIPSIGVSSPLLRLGLQDNGSMETPADHEKAGWYHPGPSPGQQGPAVIAGHVTWNGDQSVFFRLGDLAKGDRIDVRREDGRTAEFEVDRIERFPKNEFPTVDVYRNLDHAGLRLITCGGQYDEETNYYSDNVVVFASMVDGAA